jgi:peptidoglycan/LPS O-acetylase OafA/YrhL
MHTDQIPKTSYLPYLDGLRAIAAVYVVFHHMGPQFHFDYPHLTAFEKYSIISFFYGHWAVNFFSVLSGFCLTIPMVRQNQFSLKGGVLHFYVKRIKRIVIPYYLATALSLLLIATLIGTNTGRHWDASLPVTRRDIITHLLLCQDVFSNSMFKINHALWTISIEFRIYLLFPFLLWLWRKFGIGASLLATVIISALLLVIATYFNLNFGWGIEQQLAGVNPYIILFGLGMLGAYWSLADSGIAAKVRAKVPWLLVCLFLLVTIFVIPRVGFFRNLPYSFEYFDVIFGCWALSLLMLISGDQLPILKRVLSIRPLVFVGTFAYSIYLIHAPLIQLVWQYLINPLHLSEIRGYYLMITLGTLLIIFVSYWFYRAFERPFMNHTKPV